MRRSRASRRRRAAVVTPQPRAVAAAAAPRTIQKCAGWFSQCPSMFGRTSSAAKTRSGEAASATQCPERIASKVSRLASILTRHEGGAPRLLRARAPRRLDGARRGACHRPEARRAVRARTRRRRGARPAPAPRGGRAARAPDDARRARRGRALRAPALDRAPAGRGGAAPPSGREDRDRPADRGRLLLRLRVPGAHLGGRPSGHRGRDPERDRGGARVDARGGVARGRARALRGGGAAVQGGARERRGRADLPVHAGSVHGSLPRPAPAERRADQGGQADERRRRVLARRRAEHAADADLRDGLLLAGRSRRTSRAPRAGAGSRPSQARPRPRPLPPLGRVAGIALLAPARHGVVERPRGPPPPREPAPRVQRGEDASPVRPADVRHVGPLRELRGEHVLRADARGRGAARAEADELPRPHAPLRIEAALVPRPSDPVRGVVHAPPRRAGRDAARPAAGAAHHAGRRARLRHGGADPGRDRRDDRLRPCALRAVRRDAARRAVDAARTSASARTSSGIGPRPRSSRRSGATASSTRSRRAKGPSTGRRSTCT